MGEGITQAQYDQVNDAVNPSNHLVPGMISHAAGMTGNTFCVIEVWESQEAIERFFKEHLGAAFQEANITTRPVMFQVTNMLE